MFKLRLLFFVLFSSQVALAELPAQYSMSGETNGGFGNTLLFNVQADGQFLGRVVQGNFRLWSKLTFLDQNQKKVAYAKTRFLATGTTVDVYDADSKRIGTIKQKVFTPKGFPIQLHLFDKKGKEIAKLERERSVDF